MLMFQKLYKQNIHKHERQELRRKKLLQEQKLKRLELQDGHRLCDENDHNEGKKKYNRTQTANIENIHLQLSEWLKEKPENFDDWLLVPCPKGQRCLVVTEKGKTKMFSKNKRYRMTFSSVLPGGGLIGSDKDYCILDCIYSQEKDTFYILDALHFLIPLVDCDTEFRCFWLKSKLCEIDNLGLRCKSSNLKNFHLLDYFDISKEVHLTMALQKYPLWRDNQPQLDGFLFYHKNSHYVFGTTPLVCWLFPYMLPDVLQLAVSNFYKPPDNYSKQNPWHYMDEFDKMSQKRNKNIQNKSSFDLMAEEDAEIPKNNLNESNYHVESLLETEIILKDFF